jgi:hypothetical protein
LLLLLVAGDEALEFSGDEYWVSGIKRNGEDRRLGERGRVEMDKAVVVYYLEIVGISNLIPATLREPAAPVALHRQERKICKDVSHSSYYYLMKPKCKLICIRLVDD